MTSGQGVSDNYRVEARMRPVGRGGHQPGVRRVDVGCGGVV